jgi:hypothetical protein
MLFLNFAEDDEEGTNHSSPRFSKPSIMQRCIKTSRLASVRLDYRTEFEMLLIGLLNLKGSFTEALTLRLM